MTAPILQGELIKRNPSEVEKSITGTDYPIGSGVKLKEMPLLTMPEDKYQLWYRTLCEVCLQGI